MATRAHNIAKCREMLTYCENRVCPDRDWKPVKDSRWCLASTPQARAPQGGPTRKAGCLQRKWKCFLEGSALYDVIAPQCASVRLQPVCLTIRTKKWFLGAGFLIRSASHFSFVCRAGVRSGNLGRCSAASQACHVGGWANNNFNNQHFSSLETKRQT